MSWDRHDHMERRGFLEGTGEPIPRWKENFVYVALYLGWLNPLLWIFTFVSVNRWKRRRQTEPFWAWIHGMILAALLAVAIVVGIVSALTD